MEAILNFIGKLNDNVIWGLPMVILMIGTGIFLTFLTKGVIFTKFNVVMRYTTKTLFRKVDKSQMEDGAMTPFQAVCTALAATVGTGNIVGVALAIATGGPGAVAGMVGGAGMVFLWKLVISKLGGIFAIYELLPAFIFSSICIVVVSLMTAPPSKEIEEDFESVKAN